MGAVYLVINMAGINKKNLVLSWGFLFTFIQKPKRTRKNDRIKEIRADRHHHIHCVVSNQPFSNFKLRGTGISRSVRHNKSRSAFGAQCAVEYLNP
ncbi:hypothetical protein ES707_05324 [subsurface metagenome]